MMESCMCFPVSFRRNDSCLFGGGEEEGDGDTCFPRCWGSNTCLSTCLVNRSLFLGFGLIGFPLFFRLGFGLDLWAFVWACILDFIPIIIILRWKKKKKYRKIQKKSNKIGKNCIKIKTKFFKISKNSKNLKIKISNLKIKIKY